MKDPLAVAEETVEQGGAQPSVEVEIFDRAKFVDECRDLFRIHNGKAAWSIARQWIVIVAAFAFALWSRHWAGYVLAALVIATRQHALGVIMHEQTHYRLFTNRRGAEWLSDWFCAFPIGLSTNLYRSQHLPHHNHTNTDRDPYWRQMTSEEDWNWPKAQWECMKIFLYDLVGINILKITKILSNWMPLPRLMKFKESELTTSERIRFVCFLAAVLTILSLSGGWFAFLVLWMLPLVTIMSVFFRMRGIAEHLVLPNEHELNKTRHVQGTLLERLSIAPLHINYHIAHHLFPAAPQYNLPRLHERLMQNENFRKHACLTPNYTSLRNGVLAEIVTDLGASENEMRRGGKPGEERASTQQPTPSSRLYP